MPGRLCLSVLSRLVSRSSTSACPLFPAHTYSTGRRRTPPTDPSDEAVFEDINHRIVKFKQQLKKIGALASPKARHISSSISNLSQSMAAVQQKRSAADAAAQNAVANIPAFVSIEILSNGTTHLQPCVALRTPLKTYLFNCPEGTSRFLPALRLKSINVHDIFITRGTWDNIGGISSILLSKEHAAPPMRIHGALNIKHFLECIRPFQDSDFGSVKYPSQVDECPYTVGGYEDAGLRVTYIPLSSPLDLVGKTPVKGITVDVAYLIELKEPARKIDLKKIMELKVPKGPLIGRLKAGDAVSLPDGRTIQPEDVYLPAARSSEEKRTLLVVECADMDRVNALLDSSVIRPFIDEPESHQLDYVVHLSKPAIFSSDKFQGFVEALGKRCEHIVVNGSGPCVPHIESVYRNQRVLSRLLPCVFPDLMPVGWAGTVAQNADLCRRDGNVVMGSPLQKFFMRSGGSDDPITIDLRTGLSEEERLQQEHRTEQERSEVEHMMASMYKASTAAVENPQEFPCVSFLGTSSAVPSKYRNVSGYLVETSPSSCFLVDAGEGSYGQIRVLFGEHRAAEMLLNLNVIFVTHAHQDHMNGLYTVIERRRDAFSEAGRSYVPLVLVCNRNVLKPLKTYSQCFSDLQSLLRIVDLSVYQKQPNSPNHGARARSRSPLAMTATREMTEHLPTDLYDKEKWGLEDVLAVQVHHTRMANGFVFMCRGNKLVFSGDTKPCELLVEKGKGADLLIHEATFEDGCERDAERKKHSTMGQAVEVGKKMGAKHVILTHFSARYPKVPALPQYLDEAGNVGVATDNMRARFDHLHIIPKLVPLYRDVYREELFEIDLRKDQRTLRERDEVGNDNSVPRKTAKVGRLAKHSFARIPTPVEEIKKRRREERPWTRPVARKACGESTDEEVEATAAQ